MSRKALRSLVALAAFSVAPLALATGCGENSAKPSVDTSTEEVIVKGKISFKGNPVKKGEVSFDPSNYQRKNEAARRAPIQEDGTYEVKTLVGQNRVSFSIPETARDPLLQDLSLEFNAKSGENTFDIELPPAQGGTAP